MTNHVFLAPGDISQLAADAIAFSASSYLGRDGNLCSSFEANVPGFAAWYRSLPRGDNHPVGATFWMPLENPRLHGVVVVVSTGGGRDVPDKPGLAVRAAVTAAAERLRAAGRSDRLLIALPAFRVGRGGDHRQRLQSARAQVEAAVAVLEQLDGVDVAFLTYTPALYRIFLDARRQVLGPPADDLPRYPALTRAARDGSCVLFVGAGLSAGAGLPGWNELIARLAGDLGISRPERADHLDLAQWYREHFGNARLADVLRETFAPPGLPTLAHYLLLGLPVRHVITTNYDHLIERALLALKRHPVSVVRQEDVAHTGGEAVYVVKLHGDADHAEEIVLTRDDYSTFFERRPAMALLLEGLLLNRTFFFVGYSLRDLNFREVFGRVARMLREAKRPAFATSFEAAGDTAEYTKKQWGRQRLALVPIAGEGAAEQQRQFLRFLDRLSEEVAREAPPLVLAQDVPISGPLTQLRAQMQRAGDEVEELCQREGLGAGERRFLADALLFLTRHGWRPTAGRSGRALSHLWRHLAEQAADAEERRAYLTHALASAEAFTDAEAARRALEGPVTGPAAPPA